MREDKELNEKLETAVWIARSLFDRQKTSGASANLSFRHRNDIYISSTGSCFGRLTPDEFSRITLDGELIGGPLPSKEYPLHRKLYEKDGSIAAVIHIHSPYATLWSCLDHENVCDVLPAYTPYLKMRLGSVGLIPYAPPGSEELFELFELNMQKSNGYLLKNHGPIVGAKSLMEAFYCIEELEDSARIAWELEK